jgi:membrane fusion protein, adhesin transport system
LPSQFSGTTRSLVNDNSRYALFAWLLAAVLLCAWSVWFFFSSVTVYEVSTKAHLEVQQAPHPLAALVAGKVAATALVIGREVQTGEIVAELDANGDKLRLQEEQSRLAALEPRLASLKKEIAALEQARADDQRAASAAMQAARSRNKEARVAAEFAQENGRRLKDESGAGSVAEMDALRALSEAQKLSAASDALSSDGRRLELDALSRAQQSLAQIESLKRSVVTLEGESATARLTIRRLETDLEKYLVRAPIAGWIGDAVPVRPGEYVTAGQRLATVVPRGDLIIVADFNPAAALGRVHPGQHAHLRLDSFPWTQYGSTEAIVSRVATEVRDNLVRVEFALAAPPAAGSILQHGLPGSIEVNVDHASPAVLLLRASGQLLARTP